jgi:alanine racemase
MDMLFVKVDDSIKVGDRVAVIKDIEHIKEIAKYLDTITYEVICSINKRVPRVYKG